MGSDLFLAERDHKRYLKWLGRERLICEVCGEEILAGSMIHRAGELHIKENPWADEVVSNENCRLYHIECFEGLFLEC